MKKLAVENFDQVEFRFGCAITKELLRQLKADPRTQNIDKHPAFVDRVVVLKRPELFGLKDDAANWIIEIESFPEKKAFQWVDDNAPAETEDGRGFNLVSGMIWFFRSQGSSNPGRAYPPSFD